VEPAGFLASGFFAAAAFFTGTKLDGVTIAAGGVTTPGLPANAGSGLAVLNTSKVLYQECHHSELGVDGVSRHRYGSILVDMTEAQMYFAYLALAAAQSSARVEPRFWY